MIPFLFSFSQSTQLITNIEAIVKDEKKPTSKKSYNLGEIPTISCTENETLSFFISTNIKSKPSDSVISIENGIHSISSVMTHKNSQLQATFSPNQLGHLNKHSAVYSVKILIYDSGMDKPLLEEIAKLDFTATGEDVDNFTDVEWDFQPPHPKLGSFKVKIFNVLACVPFGIFILLFFLNGINFGYFPRHFFDAIFSLVFVVSLGAFFVFFIYFWRKIHFEDMIKYLCFIVPVLGLLLRRALIGRAKMVNENSNITSEHTKDE